MNGLVDVRDEETLCGMRCWLQGDSLCLSITACGGRSVSAPKVIVGDNGPQHDRDESDNKSAGAVSEESGALFRATCRKGQVGSGEGPTISRDHGINIKEAASELDFELNGSVGCNFDSIESCQWSVKHHWFEN